MPGKCRKIDPRHSPPDTGGEPAKPAGGRSRGLLVQSRRSETRLTLSNGALPKTRFQHGVGPPPCRVNAVKLTPATLPLIQGESRRSRQGVAHKDFSCKAGGQKLGSPCPMALCPKPDFNTVWGRPHAG